jgi:hypothetical protein
MASPPSSPSIEIKSAFFGKLIQIDEGRYRGLKRPSKSKNKPYKVRGLPQKKWIFIEDEEKSKDSTKSRSNDQPMWRSDGSEKVKHRAKKVESETH